jgi:hypothetical protein
MTTFRRWSFSAAWISLTIAVAAVTAWWIWGGFLDGWLYNLYWPSLAVAIALSGNLHDINPVIGFVAQVVQTFLMIYIVALCIGVIKRSRTRQSA